MEVNYFTIEELTYSDTANKLKIDNTPSKEIEIHLKELIKFLNPLREAWGSAIKVTSGYRCSKLNKAVGGSITSAHLRGYAADLVPKNNKMSEFKSFCKEYLKNNMFDQCLLEKSGNTEWVHIGLYNNQNQQRKQIKILNV